MLERSLVSKTGRFQAAFVRSVWPEAAAAAAAQKKARPEWARLGIFG